MVICLVGTPCGGSMADEDAIHLLLLLPAAPARIPLVSSTGSGTDGNGRRCDTEEEDARRRQWCW
jgi:hypothetical protein